MQINVIGYQFTIIITIISISTRPLSLGVGRSLVMGYVIGDFNVTNIAIIIIIIIITQ